MPTGPPRGRGPAPPQGGRARPALTACTGPRAGPPMRGGGGGDRSTPTVCSVGDGDGCCGGGCCGCCGGGKCSCRGCGAAGRRGRRGRTHWRQIQRRARRLRQGYALHARRHRRRLAEVRRVLAALGRGGRSVARGLAVAGGERRQRRPRALRLLRIFRRGARAPGRNRAARDRGRAPGGAARSPCQGSLGRSRPAASQAARAAARAAARGGCCGGAAAGAAVGLTEMARRPAGSRLPVLLLGPADAPLALATSAPCWRALCRTAIALSVSAGSEGEVDAPHVLRATHRAERRELRVERGGVT